MRGERDEELLRKREKRGRESGGNKRVKKDEYSSIRIGNGR